MLEQPELHSSEQAPGVARLRYAYADTLEELGRIDEAIEWFARAEIADLDGDTDAGERRAELM